MHFLLDLGLPGLVFLGLSAWLVRKAVKAARTERDLEGDRLQGALAEELQAARARAAQKTQLAPVPEVAPEAPVDPMAGADVRGANPEHVALIQALIAEREAQLHLHAPGRIEVLWVRSSVTHVAWCERRHTDGQPVPREVICVAQLEGGKLGQRWSFG